MPNKLAALQAYLLANRGRFLSRSTIRTVIWGDVPAAKGRGLDVYIGKIRDRLGPAEEIVACQGRRTSGYMLLHQEDTRV